MQERLLNYHQLKQKTGLARSTVYELERAGKFPKRRTFGARACRWVESEVDSWIQAMDAVDLTDDNNEDKAA